MCHYTTGYGIQSILPYLYLLYLVGGEDRGVLQGRGRDGADADSETGEGFLDRFGSGLPVRARPGQARTQVLMYRTS